MGLTIYMLAVMAVTFLAALIWRPVVAALVLAGAVALGCAAPFIFFGVRSVMVGEPILGTWALFSVTFPAIWTLAGYTVKWSLAGVLIGAALRWGWTRFARRTA